MSEEEYTELYLAVRKTLIRGNWYVTKQVDELKNKFGYEMEDIHHDIFLLFIRRNLMANKESGNEGGYIHGTTHLLLKEILRVERRRKTLREENTEAILTNCSAQ